MNEVDLRYPIGKFARPEIPLDHATRMQLIDDIARMPSQLRALVEGLSDAQLELRYRPAGWTIRQVVHHVPDSHVNMYIRTKLALTEDQPTIKLYREASWAELTDGRIGPIRPSLDLLEGVHFRWAACLRDRPAADFMRAYVHPEMGVVPLDVTLALYEWHGRHHLAHIRQALERG